MVNKLKWLNSGITVVTVEVKILLVIKILEVTVTAAFSHKKES